MSPPSFGGVGGQQPAREAGPAWGTQGVEQRAAVWPGMHRAGAAAGAAPLSLWDLHGVAQPLKLQQSGLMLGKRTEDLVCSFSKALFF